MGTIRQSGRAVQTDGCVQENNAHVEHKSNEGEALETRLEVISGLTRLDMSVAKFNRIQRIYRLSQKITEVQKNLRLDMISLMIVFVIGLHNLYGFDLHDRYEHNQDKGRGLRPVSIKFVANALCLSRENVRRRLVQLVDNQIISKVERKFVVNNWRSWDDIYGFFAMKA